MTSAANFGACQARAQSTGAWRSSQKFRWRVEARATSFECHFSSVGRSVVSEAFMVARVHENDLEVRESEAAREILSEAIFGAWRRVARLPVTEFLGFPYGRPRSTLVWLVSSGEGLICTNM